MKKYLFTLSLFTMTLSLFGNMEEKILSSWFDGFNRRDIVSMTEIYADDALIHGKEGLLKGGEGNCKSHKKMVRCYA